MRAMILAAGHGTRLKPLTNNLPKSLVQINGKPLILVLLDRLIALGVQEICVNAHHESDQLFDFLSKYNKTNRANINISFEKEILNTGGGIKKMLHFFSGDEPIIVHNVDIICSMNYKALLDYHSQHHADCTLVVNERKTNRPLCFNHRMVFCGRSKMELMPELQNFGFCGIQVIQPSIFSDESSEAFYSIDAFIKAASLGKNVIGYNIGDAYWKDVGTLKDIAQAEQDIARGMFDFS